MSLLLVCGAVFIGKEGRSSKSPPSVVPPPGLALSSLRLRQPDILPSDRQPDTPLVSGYFFSPFDSPPLLPLFVRTVISHRLVWCQALAISALPGVRLLSVIFVRTVISCHLLPNSALPSGALGGVREAPSPSVAPSVPPPLGEQLFSFPRISGAGQGEDWQGWKRGGGEKAGREGRGASRVQRREAQAWTH